MDLRPKTSKRARTRLLAQVDAELAKGKTGAFWGELVEFELLAQHDPVAVWPLVVRWGGASNKNVRECAQILMEIVINHHWRRFVPRALRLAAKDRTFAASFLESLETCWTLERRSEISRYRRRFRRVRLSMRTAPLTIQEILNSKDTFMDLLFARVSSKRRRTPEEYVAYRLHLLYSMIPDDGLLGFVANVTADDVKGAAIGLRAIGLTGPAALVDRAIGIIGPGGLSKSVAKRDAYLDGLAETQRMRLGKLEGRLSLKNLERRLRRYVADNVRAFGA